MDWKLFETNRLLGLCILYGYCFSPYQVSPVARHDQVFYYQQFADDRHHY